MSLIGCEDLRRGLERHHQFQEIEIADGKCLPISHVRDNQSERVEKG